MGMHRPLAIAVTAALLSASCGGGTPLAEGTAIYEMVKAPVTAISIDTPIMVGDAAKLSVTGTFTDTCTTLDRFITKVGDGVIDVTVYARTRMPACTAGEVPFAGNYYISGVPAGAYTLRVNTDEKLTAPLAVIQGKGDVDAGAAPCTEVRLDAVTAAFPGVIMAGQDLVIALEVKTPDTCHSFSQIGVTVEGTGILLAVNGWACDPGPAQSSACAEVAQVLDLSQTVSGLQPGSYAVFVNGANVGVVQVMEASQCASSLAPVQAVTAPASIRAGEPCAIAIAGAKPEGFSLAPVVETRAAGTAALTLGMFSCGSIEGEAAPFNTAYSVEGLTPGTWAITVNDMATTTVSVLPACEERLAPVEWADIYSSLYDNGTGQVLTEGSTLDAVVGGTFADGCWTFDGFDYQRTGNLIGLNAMARYCPGPCADMAQEFRETYTIYGLEAGHYIIVLNGAKKFEFDVVK